MTRWRVEWSDHGRPYVARFGTKAEALRFAVKTGAGLKVIVVTPLGDNGG